MMSLLLYYFNWYIGIGIVTTFIIDQIIRITKSSDPYTAKEILIITLIWPINVSIFIYSFFRSFF